MIVADSHAEVYTVNNEVAVCERSGHSRFRVGVWDETLEEPNCLAGQCVLLQVALAGDAVAYASTLHSEEQVFSWDVANRRLLHDARVETATRQEVLLEWAEVDRLVVGPTGAVAWIQEDSYARHGGGEAPPAVFGVFGLGSEGSRTFATNLPAKPFSLRLSGDRLTWNEQGRTFSGILR